MITDPKIFLTGASSGIGLETARLLSARGFAVWGTARDVKRLPTLPKFSPVQLDLADVESIRDNFSVALEQAGNFDILINNAGAGCFGPYSVLPLEVIREHFQVLVHGPMLLAGMVLPQMQERQRGLIVNITSLASRFPVPYLGPYNSAKAALVSASQSLRLELAHTPIRVVDLQPADIRTNFAAATRRFDEQLEPSDKFPATIALNAINTNMASAPPPEIVARAILKIITSTNPPPVVTVGSFFEAHLAPFLARFGSPRLIEWSIRRFYKLPH